MQNQWRFYLVVVFMGLIGQFATELYLPSMPAMALALHVPINMIQFTIAVYVFGFSVGSLVYGTLSDVFGRKPVMFTCLIIGLVGSVVCCLSFNIHALFIGRFIQGLGFSGAAAITRSITRDISADQKSLAKLASILGILNSTAIAFAPVVGGYVQKHIFWRANFMLILLMDIAGVLLCWFKLHETNQNKHRLNFKVIFFDYVDVLSNPQFLLYNTISALTLAGVISYQTISSSLLQVRVGLGPEKFGYTALIVTGALIVGSLVNSKTMPKRGTEKMITAGCWLYTIGGLALIVSGAFNWVNTYVILIPMVLYMLGAGLVYPNCSSGAMSIFSTKAGTAASIYNCFQMVGATIGSSLVSTNVHGNQLYLGMLLTIVGFAGLYCSHHLHLKTIKQIAKV